jgi:hypothetical protein
MKNPSTVRGVAPSAGVSLTIVELKQLRRILSDRLQGMKATERALPEPTQAMLDRAVMITKLRMKLDALIRGS